MRFLFVLFGSIAVLGLLEILLMRLLNREVWQTRWGKALSVGWPVATLLVAFVRILLLGESTPHWVVQLMMELAAFLLVGLFASIVALILVGIIKGAVKAYGRMRRKPSVALESRREFLKTGVSALPALAAVGSGIGVVGSLSGIRRFDMPLKFKNLPSELEGFRILHLSDLHLGPFLNLSDLEKLVEQLSAERFDLVTLIGDVADDLDMLAESIRIVKAIPSRFGHFATLGNHEYYRGIHRVRRTFDAGPIPLLVNEGLPLTDDTSSSPSIFVGGADDPVTMGWKADRETFYRRAVESSFDSADSDSFRVLLTHRPGAFDEAAAAGIDLSLAGHTHGGQVGLLGRSMFEPVAEEFYLWGRYSKGDSQLYTSSGVGHWFPFRLGCPAEAPTIILKRA
jgi:uncharacterized protein